MVLGKSTYDSERRAVNGDRRYMKLPWLPLEHAEDFLEELRIAMRSETYIQAMRRSLSYFFLWCRDNDIRHPNEIERRDLLHYQAWVQEQEWKRNYQIMQMVYLRVFFSWLMSSSCIAENPWYNMRIGSIQKLPNPLAPEDVELLFQTHTRRAFRLDPFNYHREEVILVLLYSWGLRIHELVALNVEQFDIRADFVTSINKGGTNKSLPYHDQQKNVVERWLTQRSRYALPDENGLLIGRKGNRLGTQAVRLTIDGLGREAGIRLTPHMLRDTCGTDLLTADVPLERVAKILGHSNLRYTLAYAKVRDRRVAEDHERVMGPRIEALLDNGIKRTGSLAPKKKPQPTKKSRRRGSN